MVQSCKEIKKRGYTVMENTAFLDRMKTDTGEWILFSDETEPITDTEKRIPIEPIWKQKAYNGDY